MGMGADMCIYYLAYFFSLARVRYYYSRLATGMCDALHYLEFQTGTGKLAIGRFHVNVASISPDPRCQRRALGSLVLGMGIILYPTGRSRYKSTTPVIVSSNTPGDFTKGLL